MANARIQITAPTPMVLDGNYAVVMPGSVFDTATPTAWSTANTINLTVTNSESAGTLHGTFHTPVRNTKTF